MKAPRIVRNKLLRKRVFDRDQGVCIDCQRFDPRWEHDHEIPLWQGGADTLENSVTRCRRCHMRKTVGETPLRAKADRLHERSELTRKRREIRA